MRAVPAEIRPKGERCVECKRRYRLDYYARNREREVARQRAYYRAHKAERAAYAHAYYLAHREEVIERTRDWERRHPGAANANRREWYERMRQNPERFARYLEDQRLASRLRAERDGKPKRSLSEAEYFERYGNGSGGYKDTLPAEPLRALLEEQPPKVGALARQSGVSERRISSVIHGQQKNVSLRLADCICTAIGIPLALVYGEGL